MIMESGKSTICQVGHLAVGTVVGIAKRYIHKFSGK